MTSLTLQDRTVLKISGADAKHFIGNLVTCDIEKMQGGDARFGALLSPQGKVLYDFFIIMTEDGFLLDTFQEQAEELKKRLIFYRLRAKVDIETASDMAVIASWGDASSIAGIVVDDPRHQNLGKRIYTTSPPASPSEVEDGALNQYEALRISTGIPNGGQDFAYGDVFPHEILMDQYGGVDFKKGCYVGQEVVSRMQHRSTARKRMVIVVSDEMFPPSQGVSAMPLLAGDTQVGTMGSSNGKQGLALVRLDRAKRGIDGGHKITCGMVALNIVIPDWVNFGWPN